MSTPAKRLDKTGWLDLGLKTLGKNGPEALGLHRLCETAGKTTGSFYHHFPDHDAFLSELMAHWAARNTDALIKQTSDGGAMVDRLVALESAATALSAREETGVRKLVSRYPALEKSLAEVDNKRLEYLQKLMAASLPGLTTEEARAFAEIEYASFVGAQMLWPDNGTSAVKTRQTWSRKLLEAFGTPDQTGS